MNLQALKRPRYADHLRIDQRKVPNDVRRTWQVGEMWEIHAKIKRLIFQGLNNKEIAERIDRTPQFVSNVRNSKIIQDQLAIMHAAADANSVNVRKEIQEFAPIALELLKNVIKGEGPGKNAAIGLRVNTSKDMLDRAGHGKVVRTENLHGHFTAEELDEIKARAKKRARENGQVVEAEYEEVK